MSKILSMKNIDYTIKIPNGHNGKHTKNIKLNKRKKTRQNQINANVKMDYGRPWLTQEK